MPTCLIDQTEHATLEDLHHHLQFKLRVRQADYYTTHLPRKDRFTGESIPFKSRDQYLTTEFTSRENLRKWTAANPVEGRLWAFKWLANRKRDKSLVYPPTQVELESLLCPSIHYYDRSFEDGYTKVCKLLGYTIRFNGTLTLAPLLGSVVVDSREQKPLTLVANTVTAKLNCGDYGLESSHDQGVYIERKSLNDFIGTLSDRKVRGEDSNLARFTRELERAEECGAYLVILVEDTIQRALAFDDLREFHHVKITPDHVFKNLRDLLVRFQNVQALFVAGRTEAANAVIKLLSAGQSVKTVDLQHAYEAGKLYLKT